MARSSGYPPIVTSLDLGPDQVALDGFHAVKHALRFGADIRRVIASEDADIDGLSSALAPDLAEELARRIERVTQAEFRSLRERHHPTGILAVATRPKSTEWSDLDRSAPVVAIDDPRHHGNVGAAVRISAAGGAAGFATIGALDPWSPGALRGSAGLHFALPVLALDALPDTDRPVYAFDPDGTDLSTVAIPADAVLVFGSERHGLDPLTKVRADLLVGFPMRPGVSSINLAASVAIGLYHWRLSR